MFLKKHFTIIGLACVLSVPAVDAGAEGFAINEWSAEGVAMGGARMFAENDSRQYCLQSGVNHQSAGRSFKQSAVYISRMANIRLMTLQESLLTKVKTSYMPVGLPAITMSNSSTTKTGLV